MTTNRYEQKPQPISVDEREKLRRASLRSIEEGKAAVRRMILRCAIKVPKSESERLGIK